MPVAIAGELPVGIVGEHSLLTVAAQVVAAGVALLLLLAGRVFPRTVRGIFYLLLAGLVGFRFFAATSYLLVLLAALLLFGLGTALSLYWPRAAMAIADQVNLLRYRRCAGSKIERSSIEQGICASY